MRNLTQEEIEEALDDNGEVEEGCVAIEATVRELAVLGVGTCCGGRGNKTFQALVDYEGIICRGWLDEKEKVVVGMFHIRINSEDTAQAIEKIAEGAGGSLRFSGDSLWDGFKEFEIE